APGAPQRGGTGRCAAGAAAGVAGQLLAAGPDGAQLWAAARRGAAPAAAAAGRDLGAAAAPLPWLGRRVAAGRGGPQAALGAAAGRHRRGARLVTRSGPTAQGQ